MSYPKRIEVIKNHAKGAVLDVGCVQHTASNEEDPTWLHQYLYEFSDVESVLGIDILEDDVGILQEKGYNVQQANAETCSLEQTFDTIIAGELIEHLSNPGMFLNNMYDHLHSDGRLIMTTPNTFNILRFMFLIKNGYVACNDEHTCWFDPKTLRQLVKRHGFKIQYLDKYAFSEEYEFIDPVSRAIRAVTPVSWTAETLVAVCTPRK